MKTSSTNDLPGLAICRLSQSSVVCLIVVLLMLAGFAVDAQVTNAPKEDVNARGLLGWTALHFAAQRGNVKEAAWLLTNNADVNARGDDGATPLHLTTACGARWVDVSPAYVEVARLLLAHNADVNAMDKNGQTPLHLVMTQDGPPALEDLLRQHGGLDKPLSYLSPHKHYTIQKAIQLDDTDSIKEILSLYPDLITNNTDGLTLLHYATFFGSTNSVKTVLGCTVKRRCLRRSVEDKRTWWSFCWPKKPM